MLPREFYRRVRAHGERMERREEAAWTRTLFQANTTIELMNLVVRLGTGKKGRMKPFTMEKLKAEAKKQAARKADADAGPLSEDEYRALLQRIHYLQKHGERKVLN